MSSENEALLKQAYKFIKFEEVAPCNLTPFWECINIRSNSRLGTVTYYTNWRQWVVEFAEGCVFNDSCLRDITHFLGQLNTIRKGGKPT